MVQVRDSKHLPGWGAEGGDWAELDRLNEEELAAAEAALLAGGWVGGWRGAAGRWVGEWVGGCIALLAAKRDLGGG